MRLQQQHQHQQQPHGARMKLHRAGPGSQQASKLANQQANQPTHSRPARQRAKWGIICAVLHIVLWLQGSQGDRLHAHVTCPAERPKCIFWRARGVWGYVQHGQASQPAILPTSQPDSKRAGQQASKPSIQPNKLVSTPVRGFTGILYKIWDHMLCYVSYFMSYIWYIVYNILYIIYYI